MTVLDASVIVKWIQDENYSENARFLRQKHLEGTDKIIVPRLLFYEVANTLATKSSVTERDIKIGLDFIYATDLMIPEESNEDIIKSAKLAEKYDTTFYDMLYAVVAKNRKCELITADENFIKKTSFKFVKHISEIKS